MEMLGMVELMQTRFYQEVYQEGELQGRHEGELQGRYALIVRQLQRKLGSLSPAQIQKIQSLSLEQLESLGEALLDFTTQADLDSWFGSLLT